MDSKFKVAFFVASVSISSIQPITVIADELVFLGKPIARIVATSTNGSHEEILDPTKRDEFKLMIAKNKDGYYWASREQKPLIDTQAGAYVHFFSPTAGWIKIVKVSEILNVVDMMIDGGHMPESMRPNLVQEMLKQNFIPSELEGAEYIYFEVVTQGMLVGAYWGIADKFDYPYQSVNH